MNITITSYNTRSYHETFIFSMNMDNTLRTKFHDDTSAESCNDFYPIHCQQGKDQKILRLHNDGENFSLNSISTDFSTSSVQLAADCIRMGRTINQFRRLCRPGSPISLSSSESSTGTCSSISVIETDGIEKPGSSYVERVVHEDCDIDEDEDDYVCEINANDHHRLCKARTAHDLVISDSDTLLAKKKLSATTAPHLRTQDLITKLDDVAKLSIWMFLLYYKSNSKAQY